MNVRRDISFEPKRQGEKMLKEQEKQKSVLNENKKVAHKSDGSALYEGVIYTCMNPNAKITDIQNVCKVAIENNYSTICVPEWFVSFAKEQIGTNKVNIATIVGLPGGTTSSAAKYAETKMAINSGASMIIIPVNMSYCIAGNLGSAMRDIKEVMVPAKRKACTIALIEMEQVTKSSIKEITEMCIGCGVDGVMISYVMGGKPDNDIIKTAAGSGIKVGIYNCNNSLEDIKKLKKAGAASFTVSKL